MVRLSEKISSEANLQRFLIVAFLLVAPGLLYGAYFKVMFNGLAHFGAFDFAQIGRNLSEGRGFTTYFLRPLALTHGDNAFRQPDLTHGPLYPFILAMSFSVLGAKDWVVALTAGGFYMLTVPLIYILANRVFSQRVGIITATIFAANNLMLEYALSGLHICFYTFLFTALFLTMFNISERALNDIPLAPSLVILSGFLTGALYLTDSLFIWLAPVPLITLLRICQKQRLKAASLFFISFVIVTTPWMIRNGLLTGNPVFGLRGIELWSGTKGWYPNSQAYRMLPEDLTQSVGLFKAVVNKVLLGSGFVVQTFPQVSASWMLAFLLPSLLFKFTSPSINVLRSFMMTLFLMILIGTLLFGVEMPYFVGLIPTMLAFAIAYLLHLVEEVKLPKRAMVNLIILLSIAVVLPIMSDMFLKEKPPLLKDNITARIVKSNIDPDAVILSDSPWIVAWESDRPAIWIPIVDANIRGFQKRFPKLGTVFLTESTRSESMEWQMLYSTFRQWNEQVLQAGMTGQPAPAQLRIAGTAFPILEILEGYVSVPRTRDMSVTTVLLSLPKDNK